MISLSLSPSLIYFRKFKFESFGGKKKKKVTAGCKLITGRTLEAFAVFLFLGHGTQGSQCGNFHQVLSTTLLNIYILPKQFTTELHVARIALIRKPDSFAFPAVSLSLVSSGSFFDI